MSIFLLFTFKCGGGAFFFFDLVHLNTWYNTKIQNMRCDVVLVCFHCIANNPHLGSEFPITLWVFSLINSICFFSSGTGCWLHQFIFVLHFCLRLCFMLHTISPSLFQLIPSTQWQVCRIQFKDFPPRIFTSNIVLVWCLDLDEQNLWLGHFTTVHCRFKIRHNLKLLLEKHHFPFFEKMLGVRDKPPPEDALLN